MALEEGENQHDHGIIAKILISLFCQGFIWADTLEAVLKSASIRVNVQSVGQAPLLIEIKPTGSTM